MASGLCQLRNTRKDFVFQMCEPLVCDALKHKTKDYMETYFENKLADMNLSSSAIGDLLDFNIGISLCTKYKMSVLEVSRVLLFQKI